MAGLIDDLYQKTKLDYLSDMHCEYNWIAVLNVVREIPEEEYPQKEWAEVYQYITGNNDLKNCGRTELLRTLCLGAKNKAT